MAAIPVAQTLTLALFLSSHLAAASIGVNYGGYGDNLPSPAAIASFLHSSTSITRVKLFDANPAFLTALAGTGIAVAVTTANSDVVSLAGSPSAAAAWVAANVAPYYPATNIDLVLVGNEVATTTDNATIAALVPAMRSLTGALAAAGFPQIQVSTAHSYGIIYISDPPSTGRFRPDLEQTLLAPLLAFHNSTGTPFVINPYPFYGFLFNPKMANYALFRPNAGVFDNATGLTYTNMFEAQLDAAHFAMRRVGFGGVTIAVGETGWPSAAGEAWMQTTPEAAAEFNGNLAKYAAPGSRGTPMMPGKEFDVYIFAMFDEDQKQGMAFERHWGLFNTNFTPIYDAGLLSHNTNNATPTPNPSPSSAPIPAPTTKPAPGGSGASASSGKWCLPKASANDTQLINNINYVCGTGSVNCTEIQPGGPCFQPNTPRFHAAFAMNAFYQANGPNSYNCDFAGTGVITTVDPSADPQWKNAQNCLVSTVRASQLSAATAATAAAPSASATSPTTQPAFGGIQSGGDIRPHAAAMSTSTWLSVILGLWLAAGLNL